jgi:hypothetical protein
MYRQSAWQLPAPLLPLPVHCDMYEGAGFGITHVEAGMLSASWAECDDTHDIAAAAACAAYQGVSWMLTGLDHAGHSTMLCILLPWAPPVCITQWCMCGDMWCESGHRLKSFPQLL